MKFKKDAELQALMERIVAAAGMSHVRTDRVFCVRSSGSKSRAVARTWSFPRVFQECLGVEPAYVIEAISSRWDKLSEEEKEKVMIHELLHIPKTFSGALVPHRMFGKTVVGARQVEKTWKAYKSQT